MPLVLVNYIAALLFSNRIVFSGPTGYNNYFFGYILSYLQSEVFAVAFALLAAGAVILTLNVLLLVSSLSPISVFQY